MRVFAGVAAVLGVIVSCAPVVPPHVSVDPALASLTPSDTVLLIGARIDHLRETPLYREHLAARWSSRLEEWLGPAGATPAWEVWEILAAHNGKDAVVMTRGKFSDTGLEPNLRRAGAQRSSYKGYTLIGDDQSAVFFMNATTAVAGPPKRLRAIIDLRGRDAGPPAALMEMLKTVDRSNQIWAVSLGGPRWSATAPGARFALLDSLLRKVRTVKAGVRVEDGLLFRAEGVCAGPADAEALGSALRAMIGMARLGARDRPALQALYDTISVRSRHEKVEVRADVPSGVLARLVAGE